MEHLLHLGFSQQHIKVNVPPTHVHTVGTSNLEALGLLLCKNEKKIESSLSHS